MAQAARHLELGIRPRLGEKATAIEGNFFVFLVVDHEERRVHFSREGRGVELLELETEFRLDALAHRALQIRTATEHADAGEAVRLLTAGGELSTDGYAVSL